MVNYVLGVVLFLCVCPHAHPEIIGKYGFLLYKDLIWLFVGNCHGFGQYMAFFFSHTRSKHMICITVLIKQYKCTLMPMATSYKLLIR